MGHENNGVPLPMEQFEQPHDLPTCSRVQVARRFVGKQDRGTIDQSSTDGDSLTLSSRELIGTVIRPVDELYPLEGLLRARTPLFRRGSRVDQGQLNILNRGST